MGAAIQKILKELSDIKKETANLGTTVSANREETANLSESVKNEFLSIRDSLSIIPTLQSKIETLEKENAAMRAELNHTDFQANLLDQQLREKIW